MISSLDSRWQIRLFGVDTVRIGSRGNPWNYEEMREPFWRLYCNDSDGAFLTLASDETFSLQAGEIYVVPSGVNFHSHAAREIGHFFVHFDVLGVPRRVSSELFVGPLHLPDAEVLKPQVRRLWGVGDAALAPGVPLVVELRVMSLLYEAMAQVIATISPDQMARSLHLNAQQETVRPALEFINAHLAESLTTARLASLCCLSEDYFIRRFRECVGVTPTHYIQEQRVNRAAQRLAFSDDTIERIAGATGFGSRYYFTRIFKRFTGRSPVAYRKRPTV